MECDDEALCNEIERIPWCLRTYEGEALMFPTYRALFEFACVNNIRAPRNKRYRNQCPEQSTTQAPNANPITAGNGPTGGQGPSTGAPSGGENTAESPSGEASTPALGNLMLLLKRNVLIIL